MRGQICYLFLMYGWQQVQSSMLVACQIWRQILTGALCTSSAAHFFTDKQLANVVSCTRTCGFYCLLLAELTRNFDWYQNNHRQMSYYWNDCSLDAVFAQSCMLQSRLIHMQKHCHYQQ